jgi:hypothetical protein
MEFNSIKLEIGKSYPIDYVIRQLDEFPEVQLGHIVLMHEHFYHVKKSKLEEQSKKIKRLIEEGGKEYEKRGKKFVPTSDVTILSIINPYLRYEKYDKFYKAFEPDIIKAIEESARGNIAAPTDALLSEAIKLLGMTDEEEFLDGLGLFFKRKGIDTSSLSGGKYILFEVHVPTKVKESSELEIYYKNYEDFYNSFYQQIIGAISSSKKGEIGAAVEDIINEAKKLGYDIKNGGRALLRGMNIYFGVKGIKAQTQDGKFVYFKKK